MSGRQAYHLNAAFRSCLFDLCAPSSAKSILGSGMAIRSVGLSVLASLSIILRPFDTTSLDFSGPGSQTIRRNANPDSANSCPAKNGALTKLKCETFGLDHMFANSRNRSDLSLPKAAVAAERIGTIPFVELLMVERAIVGVAHQFDVL